MCFVKEGTIVDSFSKKLLQIEPKKNMHFCLKILKMQNVPSIRYKMIWSHHVQVVKQHIRSY